MPLPKLDTVEAIALVLATLLKQFSFLVASVVFLVVMDALVAGKGISSLTMFSWASPVFASLTAQPLHVAIGAACVTAFVLFALATWQEARGLKNENARRSIMASRQGIAGEMPRLPLLAIIALMALVGFSEELLFRFLLLGTLKNALAPLCGVAASIVVAIFLSTLAFYLAHTSSNNAGPVFTCLLLGVILGVAYVASGSLAIVAAAHALYNIAVLVSQRIEMRRNPNYFGGPIPTRVYVDSGEA